MLRAVHRPTACHLARARLFHSFTPLSAQFLKPAKSDSNKNASRTRLTKNLQPGSSTSRRSPRLEVAPKERKREQKPKPLFTRDSVPHTDPNYVRPPEGKQERNVSFRRRTRVRVEADWKRRRPSWGEDPENATEIKDAPRRRNDHDWSNSNSVQNDWERKDRKDEDRSTRKIPRIDLKKDPKFPAFPLPGQQHLQPSSSSSRPRLSPQTPHKKAHDELPVLTEFYDPRPRDSMGTTHQELLTEFTSPPLMPGLLSCLTDILGPTATPTPIQSLSLKWLLDAPDAKLESEKTSEWKQFLLASETGSGKSIAYLLPLLQNLKLSELNTTEPPTTASKRALNPRALILAPTHELSRQLSGFAKALLHKVKLRVLCASRANVKNTKERNATTRKMVAQFEEEVRKSTGHTADGEFDVKEKFPVDVVVGTPMKLLEMVRGRGWDRKEDDVEEVEASAKLRRGRDKIVGFGKWRNPPEMGLANIEWVIVDEADVLFDPDFQATTRQLLADISEARGRYVPFSLESNLSGPKSTSKSEPEQPLDYPFNLILTSATIPSALASYLDKHHPTLMRLASPNLHHLPKTLQTEYVNWTGGNKFADIERRIRKVWAEDLSSSPTPPGVVSPLSKVLIFCNKSTKVDELGAHLEQKGIKNIALTSTSDQRKRGSNQHLEGFLRKQAGGPEDAPEATSEPVRGTLPPLVKQSPPAPVLSESRSNPKEEPHVMITTSLLSRGLDFSQNIRHVFIVDEPRNMIDFLHRAGRAGRAGERGKVVVFGKMKGRGSAKAKDVRKRVGALVA